MYQQFQSILCGKTICMSCLCNRYDLTVYRTYDPAVLRNNGNSVTQDFLRKYRIRNLLKRYCFTCQWGIYN